MFIWKKMMTAAVLAMASMHAYAVPTLTFSTPAVTNGSAVDVDVVVTDVADLFGYQFSIGFDPRLLQAGSVSSGPFLGTAGTTFQDAGVLDNAAGTLSFAFGALIGAIPGASGSGTLLSMHFETLAAGTSFLTFSDILFLDSNSNDIAVSATNGALAILPVIVPPGGDVPEPSSALLLAAGVAAFAARRRAA